MKRARAPNFINAEVLHLLELVEKYPVIENKKTDGATTKEKQMAWQKIADEYNSQTNFYPRTPENLMACYKNQKVKVKKIISNETMTIKEEHGQDCDLVAQVKQVSRLDYQNTFKHLVREAKEEETSPKKETGGSSPSETSTDSSDQGLYNMFDGEYIKQQQTSFSASKIQPIELICIQETQRENGSISDHDLNSSSSDLKRLNTMKSRVEPRLKSLKKGNKKPNMAHKFYELANEKQDLVKAKKTLTDYEIQHQLILIESAKEKLQFEKRKNEMELEFLQQKYKLELDFLRNKQQ